MTLEEDSRQSAILASLAQIPPGKVCSYGRLAEMAGYKGYARYVGHILKNLPQGSTLPWHRVINSAGKISFPAGSDKYLEQSARLRAEGVLIKNGRIPLKQYLWPKET